MGRPLRPKLKLDLRAVHGYKVVPSEELGLVGYDLGELLGSGTTAVVRKAVRQDDGCVLAVKCVRSKDEEIQQFAREEYHLMASLRHPAIIRAEALQAASHCIWIVLELCQDGSLQHFVRHHGPFAEAAAGLLFRQLLEGVNYLHERRIVHRDLKPANCLLKDGATTLKITDFNSAKVVGQSQGSTAMLTDRGTHAFTAPELLLGRMWNDRVDIWACGLCLYVTLRVLLPWRSECSEAKQAFSAGKLPEVDLSELSDDMRDLLLQCLNVDMLMRPPAMKLLLHPALKVKTDSADGWLDTLLGAISKEFCCGNERSRRQVRKDSVSAVSAWGTLCGARQVSADSGKRPASVPPSGSPDAVRSRGMRSNSA
eukprot:TRINITY_DN36421_c0_g1_i1.p1 TRINITY_DN36421_c0_g1~~TRINITY_DN36421_c0_g1_i1.p1  ORF type:complete len:369 (+),score=64.60 TRINITY_DN36421_c0_g1_i1:59-1165(+)